MRLPVLVASVAGLAALTSALVFESGRFAHQEIAKTNQRVSQPRVTLTRPAADANDVPPVSSVIAEITLPTGAGVDPNTLDAGVSLVRVRDGVTVPCRRNTSGAGDDVVLKPIDLLERSTQYRYAITSDLKATDGVPFDPYSMTFTTAANFEQSEFPASFEKVELPAAKVDRDAFTSLAIGPDGLLYAGSFAGMIYRFEIKPDGTLAQQAPIATILQANRGPRLITGIAFDPASTTANPILWVSHGQFVAPSDKGEMAGAEDWTGKITRLTGNYSKAEDVIVGLPRAYKDHLNFQLAFGPDGALYFNQGSDTSVGGVDKKWGYRPEHLLTAATLRVDLSKLKTLPLDVKTEQGGTYDPYAPDAPLTLYATGIRSGFHLLFHSNGHLYSGVNGAAGNEGNIPESPDGKIPGVRDEKETTDDLLIDIRPGGYYGHPNPARGQYVLNGGNPTPGPDLMEVAEYPVGVKPDNKWVPPTFDFGKNYSPNGLIEYHSKAFGGALDGYILVTRYSDGKDIVALKMTPDGKVAEMIAGIGGFTNLDAPLDLIEEPKTGNIYIAEYSGQRITLLRPVDGKPSTQTQRTKVAQ